MPQEKLSYRNAFVQFLKQSVQGVDCFTPFVDLATDENHILLTVSEAEYTELFSSILMGADMLYPEKSHQVVLNFLKGLHCPPDFATETDDCYNYPPYAPFLDYFPANPYGDPLYVPPGYLFPIWQVGQVVGYEATDLFVNPASLPLLAGFWDLINGVLPMITINTIGDGQLEIDLLNFLNGGMAVIKVGSPPNIFDILGGAIDPNTWVVDLGIDVAIPSELDIVSSQEIDITVGAGNAEQTYIVFIPVIDDAIPPFGLPIRFGGGLRQVGLCGFESAGVIMGITDLRLVGEKLETFSGGVWTEKVDLAPLHTPLQTNIDAVQTNLDNHIAQNAQQHTDIYDLFDDVDDAIAVERTRIDSLTTVDIPQINLTLTDHTNRIISLESLITALQASMDIQVSAYEVSVGSTQETSGTVYIDVPNSQQSHTFTYPNALIIATAGLYNAYSAGFTYIKSKVVVVEGTNMQRNYGQSRKTAHVAQTYSGIQTGTPVDIELVFKSSAGHTAKVSSSQRLSYVVIEFAQGISEILEDPIVTFDAGSAPYSLPSGQVGIVTGGGNPANCLFAQSVAQAEYIAVKVDLGESKTIDSIDFDAYSSHRNLIQFEYLVDGVQKALIGIGSNNYVWENVFYGANQVGQVVEIRLHANTGAIDDMRIDNFQIITL